MQLSPLLSFFAYRLSVFYGITEEQAGVPFGTPACFKAVCMISSVRSQGNPLRKKKVSIAIVPFR